MRNVVLNTCNINYVQSNLYQLKWDTRIRAFESFFYKNILPTYASNVLYLLYTADMFANDTVFSATHVFHSQMSETLKSRGIYHKMDKELGFLLAKSADMCSDLKMSMQHNSVTYLCLRKVGDRTFAK